MTRLRNIKIRRKWQGWGWGNRVGQLRYLNDRYIVHNFIVILCLNKGTTRKRM